MKRSLLLSVPAGAALPLTQAAFAQTAVTEVYTNYGGFWTSNTTTNSSIKPDSSHLLLAFTSNGITYSTGVNDSLLTANSITGFTAAQYQAFAPSSTTFNPDGSTVIGVGFNYGGPGNTLPVPVTQNLAQYLNDGTNGLNLGTAIFNVPKTNVTYSVTALDTTAIGDGVPDLLITQVGQPPSSSNLDTFRFVDALGNTVGNAVPVNLSGVSIVGQGNWKFYNPANPPTYNAPLAGDRPMRLLAFDLADFGLDSANYSTVASFIHTLSGNSDQAFTSYNLASFNASSGTPLPVVLSSFSAQRENATALLRWTAAKASRFEVERSTDGRHFAQLGSLSATDPAAEQQYRFTDEHPAAGLNYYRLKMTEPNGNQQYSSVQVLHFSGPNHAVLVFPNPAGKQLIIEARHIDAVPRTLRIFNMTGQQVWAQELNGTRETVDISSLIPGNYHIRLWDSSGKLVAQELLSKE